MKEIGSDFWSLDYNRKVHFLFPKNTRFFLSGRAALTHIIKNILKEKEIKLVGLPNYLCHTMIKPFHDFNIKIYFYDIFLEKNNLSIKIDKNLLKCDAVLIMEYFGYKTFGVKNLASFLNKNNITLIEDLTHNIFRENIDYSRSDYSFASLRKWTGLLAGSIMIKKTNFTLANSNTFNHQYELIKKRAIITKAKFMEDIIKDKNHLKLFHEAEQILENNYNDFSLPNKFINQIYHLDVNRIKKYRRKNALFIHKYLNSYPKIKLLNLNKNDTPLFVPIFVENKFREYLRIYLINNNFYCPILWTYSKYHKSNNLLYSEELSLICDQRYSISDLRKMLKTITNVYNKFYEIPNL